jgi:hypothetical protein
VTERHGKKEGELFTVRTFHNYGYILSFHRNKCLHHSSKLLSLQTLVVFFLNLELQPFKLVTYAGAAGPTSHEFV